jgi:hypothetical protein
LVLGTEAWGEAVFNFQTLPIIIRNNGGVNVTDTLGGVNVTATLDSICFC